MMNYVRVLRAGTSLSNPATWKNRQIAVNAIIVLIGAVVAISRGFGYEIPVVGHLSDEALLDLANAVAALVCLFNGWAIYATTDKIGLPGGQVPRVPEAAGEQEGAVGGDGGGSPVDDGGGYRNY